MAHAPSAVPQKEGEPPPSGARPAGLGRVRAAFVATAERAARLGIDGDRAPCGARLPAARVPLADRQPPHRRVWRLAGESPALPARGLRRRARARSRPTSPSASKVSATDWVDGGWDVEQTIAFRQRAEKRGVDWIDVSSGGVSPLQRITARSRLSGAVRAGGQGGDRRHTIAVGLITEAQQAEEIVASGKADLVALARGMLYDPRWAWHAAASSVPRSMHHRNTGAHRRTSRRTCSARPCSAAAEHYAAGRGPPMTRITDSDAALPLGARSTGWRSGPSRWGRKAS